MEAACFLIFIAIVICEKITQANVRRSSANIRAGVEATRQVGKKK